MAGQAEYGALAVGAGVGLGFVTVMLGGSAAAVLAAGGLAIAGAVASVSATTPDITDPKPGDDTSYMPDPTDTDSPPSPMLLPTGPGTASFDPRVDATIRAAIAYAQHYGYTVSDRGSYYSAVLMTVCPMGAVVLHSQYQTCTWTPGCDFQSKAASVLGIADTRWVDSFHNGFKRDTYNDDLPDVYAYGLAYRREFMGPNA